jgi:murein DD-endopeptidase MepM/ murein hydrolase activator NlpD
VGETHEKKFDEESMSNEFDSYEPLPDHLADTGPIHSVRDSLPLWRRLVGLLSLLGAATLTVATALLLITPGTEPSTDAQLSGAVIDRNNVQPTQQSVNVAAEVNPAQNVALVNLMPTVDPALVASLLSTPVAPSQLQTGMEIVRDTYNPFTVIPDRARGEVILYEVQSGDTIFSIAERFGLKPESIAWANDRSIIGNLRPGRNINILPVDGAYWTVASQQTVQEIADYFRVDPYTIIDSEFNDLFDATPETLLTSGTQVVVPGGEAEQISWNPRVEREENTGSGGGSQGGRIIFEPGDPGSCGWVDNPGGSGSWTNPMGGGYTWSRGFTSWHTGVDLASSEGTPVKAANGGTVIFQGWNTFGYGNTVVLAHGPYTTLYGHLSAIYVTCGQWVDAGTVIAAVGTSGQSSGPHLHFEIRINDVPQDPTFTMPF